jgi:enoyl-CoA hydratase/carnithine racemase
MAEPNPILEIAVDGPVATLTMNRPEKRNAMCDALLEAIEAFYARPPEGVRVAILTGSGGHFCSGLDLSEHVARDAETTMRHSRNWHRVMDLVQFGGIVTVSALQGAVIGGGLELATATHVRIAEPSVIFQLPEGRRGIFIGGGASVRVGRILGADRMTEMMLTGRRYGADDGFLLASPTTASARARRWRWRATSPPRSPPTRPCRTTSWCRRSPASRTWRRPTGCSPRASAPP